jgi:hypothetical protein
MVDRFRTIISSLIFIFGHFVPLTGTLGQTALVDDFEIHAVNRLDGDKGILGSGEIKHKDGLIEVRVTQKDGGYIGMWNSLNHAAAEGIPLDLDALLPRHILPQFQYAVSSIEIKILDGRGRFKLELKEPNGKVSWNTSVELRGGSRTLQFELPPGLHRIQLLNWYVEGEEEDFAVLSDISLNLRPPTLHLEPERFFLWSYAQLLANAERIGDEGEITIGLARDKSHDRAGQMDNVPASGLLAAATAVAHHLGFIGRESAEEIVMRLRDEVLSLPRYHGLLPHFVGEKGRPKGEWSSLDTVICLIGLIEACQILEMEIEDLEEMIEEVDWEDLILSNGTISHGYSLDGERLRVGWDTFGCETWLVNFAYAASRGKVAKIIRPRPPTWNGSGFIDELAWLLIPPPSRDRWGIDWRRYRSEAAMRQIRYYVEVNPYPAYRDTELFGLSAAEVPVGRGYQPFGVGGHKPPNDGSTSLGSPVIVPHYAAMISSIYLDESLRVFRWLENHGLISPLNNVESMLIDPDGKIRWNGLKGSWNLALMTLGWAGYLTRDSNPLHRAVDENRFLKRGYRLCLSSR